MAIRVKQIDPTDFQAAVLQYSTGSAFSGAITAYVAASGWLGDAVVVRTGAQSITGVKTFLDSPRVPYFGGTGTAPTALYVTDQDALISGALVTRDANLSGFFMAASGNLSAVRITGSSTVPIVNLSGLGGTLVIWSGNQVFISGAAAGGGGGSNTKVTGSSAITTPNFTGVGTAVVTYDGTYVLVSGAGGVDSSGYFETNFVHRGLVTEFISGLKTFTGALGVGNPTTTGHAVNLGYLTGVSGSIVAGSTTIIYTGNSTSFSFTGVTGNFVNMSFYFDQYSLITGLNQIESFVSRDFTFTGYAIGAINTGTQGFFSGGLYQRTPTNNKVDLVQFSLNSGMFCSGRGGFSQTVSGMNRVGLDIYLIGTGITGLSVGIFGIGY